MGDKDEWYTNKQLFEMMTQLRDEMKETRSIIKRYNGLREEIIEYRNENEELKERLDAIELKAKGRSSVFLDIRVWGSLLLAVLSVAYSIFLR